MVRILFVILLVSCSSQIETTGEMNGTPIKGTYEAYEAFCKDNPLSNLCNEQ